MLERIEKAFERKGYPIEDFNIIGVRTAVDVPNVFNDLIVAVFTQPELIKDENTIVKQTFLNKFAFRDDSNKPLVVDGVEGAKTRQALEKYKKVAGKRRMIAWTATTDPGTYYLENPLNVDGTAVLKPGRYVNAYVKGYHRNRKTHPALVQRGAPVTVYRDNDKDKYAEESAVTETGFFGINIHRASSKTSKLIDKWSAGCQVFASREDLDELLALCDHFSKANSNKFTYILFREQDL